MKAAVNQVFFWALNGDYQSLRHAFENGVDVNVIDPVTTDSPMMIACRKGHTSIIQLCLHFGAKNDPHPEFGQTALHAAISESQYGSAQVLLEAAAQSEADHMISNLSDPSGQTPFHIAAYLGARNLCELLLKHGARITSIDKQGRTPLHLCAASGDKNCLSLLFECGGDEMIDVPDHGGNTALHHAVYHGRLECVRLLLETAADVHARNHQGHTPYNVASNQGHHQIGLLLLDYRDHFSSRIGQSISPQTPLKNGNTQSPVVTPYQLNQQQSAPHSAYGASPYFHDRFSPRIHDDRNSMDFAHYATSDHTTLDMNISNNSHLPPPPQQQNSRHGHLPPPSPHSQFVLQQPVNPAVALFGMNNGLQHLDSMGNYLPRPHTVNSPMVKGSNSRGMNSPFSPSTGLRSGSGSFDGSIGSSVDSSTVNGAEHRVEEGADSNGYRVIKRSNSHNAMPKPITRQSSEPTYGNDASPGDKLQLFDGIKIYTKHSIISTTNGVATKPDDKSSFQQSHNLANSVDSLHSLAYSPTAGRHDQRSSRVRSVSCDIIEHKSSGQTPLMSPTKVAGQALPEEEEAYNGLNTDQPAQYEEGEVYVPPVEEFDLLDRHWSVYYTEDNHIYYLDMDNQHSQWEDPREYGLIDAQIYEEGAACDEKDVTNAEPFGSISAVYVDESNGRLGTIQHTDSNDSDSDTCSEEPSSAVKVRFPTRRQGSLKAPERSDSFTDNPLRNGALGSSSAPQLLPSKVDSETYVSAGERNITRIMSEGHSRSHLELPSKGHVKALQSEFEQKVSTPPRAAQSNSSSIQSFNTPGRVASSPPTTPPKVNIAPKGTDSSKNMIASSLLSNNNSMKDAMIVLEDSSEVSECDSQRYIDMIRSGCSLREIGEVLEEEHRSQHYKLQVLALLDDVMLEQDPLPKNVETTSTSSPELEPAAPKESLDEIKSDSVLQKYARMLVMGVAPGNVLMKMKMDDIPIDQRNRLMRAVGEPEEEIALSSESERPPVGRKPSLHWEALPAEKVRNSIWSFDSVERVDSSGVSRSGSNMADEDLAELERLFKSVPHGSSFTTTRSIGTVSDAQKDIFKLKLLERRRAQNISIGLVQFKPFGSHVDLLKGICSLDDFNGMMTADLLDNLRPLLPTSIEIKRIDVVDGSKHPAEIFFQTAARFYPELPHRLSCFSTCLSFGENCDDIITRSKRIIDACNQVLSSSKLAKFFKKMLTVGNILNEGTLKGDAKGIRLDSILKMMNTKGIDKKTSILDYLIKSLYEKGEEEILLLTKDLNLIEMIRKVSTKEIIQEYENIFLNFQLLEDSLLHNITKQNEQNDVDPIFSSPAAKKMIHDYDIKLNYYIKKYTNKKINLEKSLNLLKRKIIDLHEYFAEEIKTGDTMEIFSLLYEFLKAIEFSRASIEWQIYKIHQPNTIH